MEWFPEFKRSLENPYNIKGFKSFLNPLFIDKNINLDEQESKFFDGNYVQKTNIDNLISNISKNIVPPKYELTVEQKKSPPTKFHDFIEVSTPGISAMDTINNKLEVIMNEKLKTNIKHLLKDIKSEDVSFSAENYLELIEDPNIQKEHLLTIINLLEDELSSYEGRGMVSDMVLMMTSFAESHFDGTNSVFGCSPNLTGLTDTVDITLRKRPIEISKIHNEVKSTLGLGPYSQLAFDIGLSCVTTTQKNSRSSSNSTKNAIKLKSKLK